MLNAHDESSSYWIFNIIKCLKHIVQLADPPGFAREKCG